MKKPLSEQMQKLMDRRERAVGKGFETQARTNGDHIRAMSDKELAHIWVEPFCDRRTLAECKGFHGDCPTCVMDWLQQHYKEEE